MLGWKINLLLGLQKFVSSWESLCLWNGNLSPRLDCDQVIENILLVLLVLEAIKCAEMQYPHLEKVCVSELSITAQFIIYLLQFFFLLWVCDN